MKLRNPVLTLPALIAMLFAAGAAAAESTEMFETHVLSDTVLFEPVSEQVLEHDLALTVTGPGDFVHREFFAAGEVVEFNPAFLPHASALSEGVYRYEIRSAGSEETITRSDSQGLEPAATPRVPAYSGAVTLASGAFVSPSLEESVSPDYSKTSMAGARTASEDDGEQRDQVIADDLIVQGSECVGFDCVNNESFGFDTIRLKENNLRIKFQDTSTGSFPTNDWTLVANDSANGGPSYLAIEDVDGGTMPFKVAAGANNNALFVDSDSRVGLRTGTPVLDLHIATGNTPGTRLEQDSSDGFSPQTWDIAGNEANFFVRDVSNGSLLPFRIRPGAPTSSLDIAASGNVGIGTTSPSSALTVQRGDGAAKLTVRETSGTKSNRTLLELENNGGALINLTNTSISHGWTMQAADSGALALVIKGSGVKEMELDDSGNLTIAGTLTQNSNRNNKDNFTEVDPDEVLSRVMELPITRWTFNHDDSGVFHMGPMAQDFHAAFGLGKNNTTIAPLDTSGVALAAIQGLKMAIDQRDRRIEQLEQKLASLKAEVKNVSRLEARIDKIDRMLSDQRLVGEQQARPGHASMTETD